MVTINKLKSTRKWLARKFRRYSSPAEEERKLSIGPPTDFRREGMVLGMDQSGNAMLVEQAREDAQEMHKASKIAELRKHARKVSAKFTSTSTSFTDDLN